MTDGAGLAAGIERDLDAIGAFSSTAVGVTRLAWSEEQRAADQWLSDRMDEIGLDVETDAAGNLFGKWSVTDEKAVLVGSHLDSVRVGGKFDGVLGVVGALHAISALKADRYQPRRPIWMVSWADEEGVRFATPLLGSHAFVGQPPVGKTLARRDEGGITLAEALASCGLRPEQLGKAEGTREIDSYVELHVELGPELERVQADIGVVTDAVGLREYEVVFRGVTSHAGTTPMDMRHDSFMAAARLGLELRDAALGHPGMTATVGRLGLEPGVSNSIPGTSSMSVDLRSPSAEDFAEMPGIVDDIARRVAAREAVEVTVDELLAVAPVTFDPALTDLVEEAARATGAEVLRMHTGGGHDAVTLSAAVPAAMIHVPSRGGIGHSPAEYTSSQDCARGVKVLEHCLRQMSST